jgi:hypothetical protein
MNSRAGRFQNPLEPAPRGPWEPPELARVALEKSNVGLRLPAKVLEQIPVWRKQWSELWLVKVGDKDYAFRSPTREDAIQHDLNMPSAPALAVDQFVKDCLLYPKELPEKMPMSEFTSLYQAIWAASGFRDSRVFEDKLALFDRVARAPEQENLLLLLRTFPGLLPDDVNGWQPEKLIYHIALARVLQGVEPIKEKKPKPGQAQAPATPTEAPKKGTFSWDEDLKDYKAFERSQPAGEFNLNRLRSER